MGFSDDQIHDILELKEQLTEEIEKHLEEIEKLEKNISILTQYSNKQVLQKLQI